MADTVRVEPTGPQKTIWYSIPVADGDKIVRPGSGDQPPTPTPTPAAELTDVLWGHGPPPDPNDPACEHYESYVDVDTGDVYTRTA